MERPLTYADMMALIQNDPRLSQMHTPLANVQQGYNSGYGGPDQILRDMQNSAESFGLIPTKRTQDRWRGQESAPSERVSQGFGDMHPLLQWYAQHMGKSR